MPPIVNLDELSPHSTALDVVEALKHLRTNDIKEGRKANVYYVREFSEANSLDSAGRMVDSPIISVTAREIDSSMEDSFAKAGIALKIESQLGVPFLPIISRLPSGKPRSVGEIKPRLDKAKKRASMEIKELRELGADISEPQNPRTIGSLEALSWLYNAGIGREYEEILRRLNLKIIEREKNKLFHKRRHPMQASLHVCHDEELLEEISILEWSVYGNVLSSIVNESGGYQGVSRF